MPHYPCHRGQNKPRTRCPPRWHLVSNAPTQGNLGPLPGRAHLWPQWAQVARRVTLNFQRTQRSPSGVLTAALSQLPLTQRAKCNKAPPPVVRAAPLGPQIQWHPSNPSAAPLSLCESDREAEIEDSRASGLFFNKLSVKSQWSCSDTDDCTSNVPFWRRHLTTPTAARNERV